MSSTMALVKQAFEMDAHEFRVVVIDGKPWWFVPEVSKYLGYKVDVLSSLMRREWVDELDDGIDYWKLEGQELKDLKKVTGNSPGAFKFTSQIMLLSESGIHTVTMLSKKPRGRKLRKWLAREVIPSIRKTGSYSMPSSPSEALELVAMRQRVVLEFAKWGRDQGLVGDDYVKREFEHATAAVKGSEPEGERQLDVSAFLANKGFNAGQLRHHASSFGKSLKAAYISKYGEVPGKGWRRVDGADRLVYCYVERDAELFEQAFEEMFGESIQPAE